MTPHHCTKLMPNNIVWNQPTLLLLFSTLLDSNKFPLPSFIVLKEEAWKFVMNIISKLLSSSLFGFLLPLNQQLGSNHITIMNQLSLKDGLRDTKMLLKFRWKSRKRNHQCISRAKQRHVENIIDQSIRRKLPLISYLRVKFLITMMHGNLLVRLKLNINRITHLILPINLF